MRVCIRGSGRFRVAALPFFPYLPGFGGGVHGRKLEVTKAKAKRKRDVPVSADRQRCCVGLFVYLFIRACVVGTACHLVLWGRCLCVDSPSEYVPYPTLHNLSASVFLFF